MSRRFLWLICIAPLVQQAQTRIATTTSISAAMTKAYSNTTAPPWAKAGAPPTEAWKNSAKSKYEGTEVASANHSQTRGIDKAFKDIALAVAMDWEIFAAETYALLQAPYEAVHPWRTGRQVRPNWTETEGNRFAALTSAIGDVLLMELTKEFLIVGDRWPNFTHALWFGQVQEAAIEGKLTAQDWQLYSCQEKRDPDIIRTAHVALHFLPQLTWITMPLDVASFVGDLLTGNWQSEWAEYRTRGAALWQEYETVHSPVVKDLLQALDGGTSDRLQGSLEAAAATFHVAHAISSPLDPVDTLELSRKVVASAINDFSSQEGFLSHSTYSATRSLFLKIGLCNDDDSPSTPTCGSWHTRTVV